MHFKMTFPVFKMTLALSTKLHSGLSKISTLVTRPSLSGAHNLYREAGKCQQHSFCISLSFFFVFFFHKARQMALLQRPQEPSFSV